MSIARRPRLFTRTQRMRRLVATYRKFEQAEKLAFAALTIRIAADPKLAITDEVVAEHIINSEMLLERGGCK